MPPKVIKGDFAHLPRDAALAAFSFLDFKGAAQAAQCCKLFNIMFLTLRARWELSPLSPSVLMRIKQLFVDWSCSEEQTRIKDHLRTADAYRGENERGTSIDWWMENYFKKGDGRTRQTDLGRQVEAINKKKALEKSEAARLISGGCKYKREELTVEFVRNCGKMKDLLEMVRVLDLKFFLYSDWRWKVLENDDHTDGDILAKRKEKFVKSLLITYMRPPVDEAKIRMSKATIDFDRGIRCAICDLCGLPFWWNYEQTLKIIFEFMSEEKETVV